MNLQKELFKDYPAVNVKEEPISSNYFYRNSLFNKYRNRMVVNPDLNRSLISFQANKKEPFYRWFKYKEGFSKRFVEYILSIYGIPNKQQIVLDPFAGVGTTVITAAENGYHAIGMELLLPAILAMQARIASSNVNISELKNILSQIRDYDFNNKNVPPDYFFKHVDITKHAFPAETEIEIANFNFLKSGIHNENIKVILDFAVTSILEDVSFTRKDGQYLRWDYRSDRNLKSNFNKGKIYGFKTRLIHKLDDMYSDISSRNNAVTIDNVKIINGSCLEKLHDLADESIDFVITSPPYCNRYDYTRIYALELAYNNLKNQEIKDLRQALLSATVENKSKYNKLLEFYSGIGKKEYFLQLVNNFESEAALKESVNSLVSHKNELNNKNIPSMVHNYFFEMNLVIGELSRILKKGGKIIMVNDNVRYNGDDIPVDLILSDFARKTGLNVDIIWILEKGKGNSSPQMGIHGRKELRKCVYVWGK